MFVLWQRTLHHSCFRSACLWRKLGYAAEDIDNVLAKVKVAQPAKKKPPAIEVPCDVRAFLPEDSAVCVLSFCMGLIGESHRSILNRPVTGSKLGDQH
jgi:hypothetical protein